MRERSRSPLLCHIRSLCAALLGRATSEVPGSPAEASENRAERAVPDREPLPARSVAGDPDFRRRLATYERTRSPAPLPGYSAL